MERWECIEEFPNYSVSDHGKVQNDTTLKVMQNMGLGSGHIFVCMVNELGPKRRGLAKLVAQAFVHNPHPRTYDTPIHLDGDVANCHASNLLWRPRWFAISYTRQFRLNLKSRRPIEDVQTGQVYVDIWDLITERGLLFREIVQAIEYNTYVFPTSEYFRWA